VDSVGKGITDTLTGALTTAQEAISGVITTAQGAITGAISVTQEALETALSTAQGAITSAIDTAATTILEKAPAAIWNYLAGWLDSMVAAYYEKYPERKKKES